MSDFNVRADSVDVEQIMRQIRARIREKRGADYTEAEIQQLAKVKLEKFLDPRGVRSDLMEQFRRREVTPGAPLPKLDVTEFSIYGTHRGALRWIRQMLQPILKLFFNPNPLVHYVRIQAQAQAHINDEIEARLRGREQIDARDGPLYYGLVHNLVVELTRASIEVHNLKMRVESLSSRLDFDERRGRSLERAVEYRPAPVPRPPQAQQQPQQSQPSQSQPAPMSGQAQPQAQSPAQGSPQSGGGQQSQAPGTGDGERRRRRRRRRRRPGQTMADQGQPGQAPQYGGGNGSADDAAGQNDSANESDGPDQGDDEASNQ